MAEHYSSVGEIDSGTVLIGGVAREIESGTVLVGGVQRDIQFAYGEPLSTLSAGDLVYIKENGINVPFLLLTHNYASDLNGEGRTLLVRRYGYDMRTFDSSNADFPNSAICSWLNGTYKALFSNKAQSLMGQTTFGYWKQNTTNTTVMTATKSIFLLSITEVDSDGWNGPDSTYMPAIASAIRLRMSASETTYYNWHLRSAVRNSTGKIYAIASSGNTASGTVTNSRASRPCFTMPETARIDPATNELIE